MSGTRHEHGDVLQVARQILRYESIHDEALKKLESENRRLKKMYAEERLKAEIHQEALEGKLSRHLNVEKSRLQRDVSIRFVCHCLNISVATYYYKPRLSAVNQQIADWLLRLTTANKRWGLG